MMSFVKSPNLPQKKVRAVICSDIDESVISFFNKNSIKAFCNKPNTSIDVAVCSHADMCAVHLGGNKIIVEKTQTDLIKELLNFGFDVTVTDEPIKGDYPNDVKLNFAVIAEHIIGNFKYADTKLSDFINIKNKICVKQGYSKCSVLVVNENAIITDDASISKKCTENGIDCLLIRKGDITLPGHEYGFIGGASGKISKNTVVFFGNVEMHRDFELIKAFLLKHECNYVCIDNENLRDIGGIIELLEE